MPAKLLEVNRNVINGYLGRTRGGKVSFTHLIGYALVRAIADHMPAMNNSFVEGPDGEPRLVRNEHVGLGIAIDMEKKDGSRSLLVPCISDADTLDFAGFMAVYDELIRKAKTNKLDRRRLRRRHRHTDQPRHHRHGAVGAPPDAGPGRHHRRRLARPTRRASPAPTRTRSPTSGISKVITISSTYDHRIIQGAESGMLLKQVHELLLGEDDFYEARLPLHRRALRGGALAPGLQPRRPRLVPGRQADAGVDPDQHAPRARSPDRGPRPARRPSRRRCTRSSTRRPTA